jgi:hypothetical protein
MERPVRRSMAGEAAGRPVAQDRRCRCWTRRSVGRSHRRMRAGGTGQTAAGPVRVRGISGNARRRCAVACRRGSEMRCGGRNVRCADQSGGGRKQQGSLASPDFPHGRCPNGVARLTRDRPFCSPSTTRRGIGDCETATRCHREAIVFAGAQGAPARDPGRISFVRSRPKIPAPRADRCRPISRKPRSDASASPRASTRA